MISLIIQLRPIKDKIAVIVSKNVSKQLNGDITIDGIEGNFFSHLELNGIRITQQEDTLVSIKTLSANYKLIPLIAGKLEIPTLEILKPELFMIQVNDSTWNLSNLLIPQEKEKPEKESGFSIKEINLGQFNLQNGGLRIVANDTLIPKKIRKVNTSASFHMKDKDMDLTLKEFNFEANDPDLTLEELSFRLMRDTEYLQLEDFYLKTSENKLEGDADYEEVKLIDASADITSSPLNIKEFSFVIPNLRAPVSPVLDLDTELQNDSLTTNLSLTHDEKKIEINLVAGNVSSLLDSEKKSQLIYNLDASLENIVLSEWLGDSALNYTINGTFNVNGQGTDPATARIDLEGKFRDCLIQERPVDTLLIAMKLESGNLNGRLSGYGDFGEFNVNPDLRNFKEDPEYDIRLITRKLNLAPLTGNDSLTSSLNLVLEASGKGFDPNKLKADAIVSISPSEIINFSIDTFISDFSYNKKNFIIDSLLLRSTGLEVKADGNYDLSASSDIRLIAKIEGLESLSPFIPVEDMKAKGQINARLSGQYDSLALVSDIKLQEIVYGDISAEEILLQADGRLMPGDTLLNADLSVIKLSNGDIVLDSLTALIKGNNKIISVSSRLKNEDLATDLDVELKPGETETELLMNHWWISYLNQEWTLREPPAKIRMDSLNYYLDNFMLASGDSDTTQFLRAQGRISRQGEEDFQLEAGNISIEQLNNLIENNLNASGIINLDAQLTGNSGNPSLKTTLKIKEAVLNGNEFSQFTVNAYLNNEFLSTDLNIIHQDSGSIRLIASLPLDVRMDSLKFKVKEDEMVNGDLTVRGFPLTVFQSLNITQEIRGYLDGDIKIKGPLESPNPNGDLRISEASIEIPEYGIDYEEMKMYLNLSQNQASIDTLIVKSVDGYLSGTGTMEFSSEIYKGDLSESRINIEFKEFNPVDHPQFNLQITGNAHLEGEKKDVVFGGEITIPEAELYIPAIMNIMGRPSAPDIPQPILVREMEKMEVSADTLNFIRRDTIKGDSARSSYFDSLEGELKVNIPRNVWIKNQDLYVEISGDLELRKNVDYMEIFGALNVVRGQYSLLGRTFNIEKGTIQFQGGEKLTPNLDIQANYVFRNAQRVEQELTVFVTGTTDSPEVKFNLDGSQISEGDALSYIMFGKSMNELSMDQQDNMAEKAAASIISSQLAGYLGEKLDVDYIDIKADEGFDNATVTVGKYITNDLFVSYEQRLGETNDKDLSKYEVRLEYELFRFLFVELNNSSNDSGFDLIFRHEFE